MLLIKYSVLFKTIDLGEIEIVPSILPFNFLVENFNIRLKIAKTASKINSIGFKLIIKLLSLKNKKRIAINNNKTHETELINSKLLEFDLP